MGRRGAAGPDSAIESLNRTFSEEGLPIPPIPSTLRGALAIRGDWLWSTREIDAMTMYFFTAYPLEALGSDLTDYVAVSHAGHGVNSYSINYHLVLGPLGVFVQVGWGGVYMDSGVQAATMRNSFADIATLLPLAEVFMVQWDRRRRLLVIDSGFRQRCVCAWFDLDRSNNEASAARRIWAANKLDKAPLRQAVVELSGSRLTP